MSKRVLPMLVHRSLFYRPLRVLSLPKPLTRKPLTGLPFILLAVVMGGLLSACQSSTDEQTDDNLAVEPTETTNAPFANRNKPTVNAFPSRQIASTVVSPDAVAVVHKLVMPASVPVTMTDYQQAYFSALQTLHREMSIAIQPADADSVFAHAMIAHHQAAIAMANIELHYGKDTALINLASDIITAQQNELWLMQDWLTRYQQKSASQPTASMPLRPDLRHIQQEYSNGLDDMHHQMQTGIMANDPDIAFVQSMLPHHKGALAMAQVELKYGDDEKLRQLANRVIDSQQSEIQFMQAWLKQPTR